MAMIVRVLKSVAGRGFSHAPGAIVELDDDEALRWIKGGIAEAVRSAELETETVSAPEVAATRTRRPKARRKSGD